MSHRLGNCQANEIHSSFNLPKINDISFTDSRIDKRADPN